MGLLKLSKNILLAKVNLIKLFLTVTLVFSQYLFSQEYIVVLDAGHGGKDPGATISGFIEKKIALSVVLLTGKELKKEKGIKVIYTRKDDTFIELHRRASIANNNNATLFVSVHCDSFKPNPRAHGASTYVLGLRGNAANLEIARKENAVILLEDDYESNYNYDPNSPESLIGLSVLQEENLDKSLQFASLLQANFAKDLNRNDRSVKQANFLVLRETIMPSVLIELGFLTNKKEGNYLNTKRGQVEMAKAIAKGIKSYIKHIKINTVKEEYAKNEKIAEKKTIVKKEEKKQPTKVTKKVAVVKQKSKPKPVVAKPKKIINKPKPVKKPKKEIKETGILFRVQIMASRNRVSVYSPKFKGLKDVKELYYDNYYKYHYGVSADIQVIRQRANQARRAGIKDAFIVAFKNGVKISIKEALQNR